MSALSTTKAAGSPVGACPADCREAYELVKNETDQTARLEPIARNRRITAAYEKLARDMPENHWVRLASYVSVQGGCAMQQTQTYKAEFGGMVFGFDPDTSLRSLGEANQGIFSSIYPANRMVANCGYEKFLQCVESGEINVPPEIVTAVRQMQRGRLTDAANTIANYEQRSVVQPVYDKYAVNFAGLKRADDSFLDPADRTSIPIAKTCTRDDLVKLDGDISNPEHRVAYYGKLLRRMYQIEGRR